MTMGFLSDFNDARIAEALSVGTAAPRSASDARHQPGKDAIRAILTMPVAIAAPDGVLRSEEAGVLAALCATTPVFQALGVDTSQDLAEDIAARIKAEGFDPVMRAAVVELTMTERRLALSLAMDMARYNPTFQIGDVLFLMEMQLAMGIQDDDADLIAEDHNLFGTTWAD
ncbi:hypothetical protein [Maritimibacter sp. DP1N21-5]|uniref:hypothetical protein n=1 Tax=Maritimibacter sp. DP1N21-5 TaxID=2836867 RepID=UPI001C4902F0|nr:hypothetical protein [Maritimibacter sp. DP1N21-5]MBV7409658.1 hypothetical protein [Maritimibacter sp. DP1N21-5]